MSPHTPVRSTARDRGREDRTVLLHVCCALCLPGPLKALTDEGWQVEALFYNPNIHPLIEFRRRLKSVKVFAERRPLPFAYVEEYGLETFLTDVWQAAGAARPARCRRCYALRLTRTAREARRRGAARFSTTLLGSHEQDHELVRDTGRETASREGVEFLYRDFRPWGEYAEQVASKMQLYRQSYCGCVFSEEERYRNTTRHLYKGSDDSKKPGRRP